MNELVGRGKEDIKYCFVGTNRVTGRREMITGVPQSLVACESVNLLYMQKAYRKQYKYVRIAKWPYKSR
jgi:hypothetical protein